MGAVSGGTQVRMAKSCANRLRCTTVSAALTVLGVGGTTAKMNSWTTLMKHRCVCVCACGVRVGWGVMCGHATHSTLFPCLSPISLVSSVPYLWGMKDTSPHSVETLYLECS